MLPISKPEFGKEEVEAAGEVILSGWVTQGPKVAQFEDDFKAYCGAKYACAVSNCTTALHLALLAVGVKPGEVVITVSHSFIATANSVRYCQALPIFIDIEPETYNMSPEALKTLLTKECESRKEGLYYKKGKIEGRVAAIMPVHQVGMPCDMSAIMSLARKYKIPVVEDAACAIGSEMSNDQGKSWLKVGKPQGDIVCFSFHPRKIISTGEGGMISTDNGDYDKLFRLLRQHGMSLPDTVRHQSAKVLIEKYVVTGYNYRMTDIQAAIGIQQLKRLPKIIEGRRNLDKLYRRFLKEITWLKLPVEPAYAHSNWQSYPIRVLPGSKASRNDLMQHLLDEKIMSKPGIMNAHEEEPYLAQAYYLPESQKARQEVILLPLHGDMKESDIKKIADIIDKL